MPMPGLMFGGYQPPPPGVFGYPQGMFGFPPPPPGMKLDHMQAAGSAAEAPQQMRAPYNTGPAGELTTGARFLAQLPDARLPLQRIKKITIVFFLRWGH